MCRPGETHSEVHLTGTVVEGDLCRPALTGRTSCGSQSFTASGGPATPDTCPTTSFLNATTLIYAIGAGITAAAGTRLALQWILVKGFGMFSFRLRGLG